ncbi:hypothetical protein ACLOJK_002347 [Asimina triloba]
MQPTRGKDRPSVQLQKKLAVGREIKCEVGLETEKAANGRKMGERKQEDLKREKEGERKESKERKQQQRKMSWMQPVAQEALRKGRRDGRVRKTGATATTDSEASGQREPERGRARRARGQTQTPTAAAPPSTGDRDLDISGHFIFSNQNV